MILSKLEKQIFINLYTELYPSKHIFRSKHYNLGTENLAAVAGMDFVISLSKLLEADVHLRIKTALNLVWRNVYEIQSQEHQPCRTCLSKE